VPTIIHSAECDTSLAPFQKRGTPAFLRKIAFVLHPLCVVSWLVAPDVVEYKHLQSDGIKEARTIISNKFTHRDNQIGRLPFIVAVEALLSTVGPRFTCWVGAYSKKD
jgi:hypothetical protein